MNHYKVEILQTEKYIVDVKANTQEEADELAMQAFSDGDYQETGDIEIATGIIYDVTNTDDPFNPIN